LAGSWNPWRGLGGLPRELWALAAATLVNRMGTMALPFLVLYLTRALRFPASQAALVLTAYGAASLLASPLGGRLCDRLGALRVMMSSLAGTGLLLLAFPFVRGFPAVMALALGWSVMNEMGRPANLTAMTSLVPPEQRKAGIALIRLAVNLGMSIGPAVGGFLAAVSFRSLFVVDAATSIAGAAVAWLGLRHSVLSRRLQSSPTAAHGGASPAGVLRDRRMLSFLLAAVLVSIVFFQHLGPMALFLVDGLHLKESTFGLLFAINTVLIVLLEVPLNLATSHWPHRLSLVVGALLTAVGFGALGFATGVWSAAATVVVWTFGEMILFPSMSSYVADAAPAERRGEYMGAYSMAFGIGFTAGPGLGTLAMERFGPFALWMGIATIGLGAAWLMARNVPGPVRVPAAAPAPAA
jgi:predicted MFS family arabinose efflux permease